MSLYAEYLKELSGKEVIEDERGFAVYSFHSGGCYIEDIYVKHECRKSNVASLMADQITKVAKEKGYNTLFGTVNLNANNPTISLKVLLGYGFELHSISNNLIIMKKGI